MRRVSLAVKAVRYGMRGCLFAMVFGMAGARSTALAQISYVDMFRSDEYLQTANGNSLSTVGSFFTTDLYAVNPNAYTSATLVPPPGIPPQGNPTLLPGSDAYTYTYQTPYFANQAAMDAAYPTGQYVYSVSNASTSLTYSAPDYYPTSLPYLTGTNYSALQGMDARSAFTFQFSPFTTGSLPGGSNSYIFLTIFDQTTNAFVYNQDFFPSSTTSLTLPADTLKNGDTYEAQLIYSNYTYVATPNTAFQSEIGFDVRSDAIFTPKAAAVPEPAAIVLFAPACGFLVWVASRRRAR
jgi:hypothetical protein